MIQLISEGSIFAFYWCTLCDRFFFERLRNTVHCPECGGVPKKYPERRIK